MKKLFAILLFIFTLALCAAFISCSVVVVDDGTGSKAAQDAEGPPSRGSSDLPASSEGGEKGSSGNVTDKPATQDPGGTAGDPPTGTKSPDPVTGPVTGNVTSAPVTEPQTTSAQTTTVTTVITTKATTTTKAATSTVTTTKAPAQTGPFKADLSAYEKYMDPQGDDWSDAYLVLVNPDNPVADQFEDSEEYKALNKRVTVDSTGQFSYSPKLYMNYTALMALTAMAKEAEANGIKGLDLTSAYRSYAKQKSIYNGNIDKTYKYTCGDCGYSRLTKNSYTKCASCGSKDLTKTKPSKSEAAKEVSTYSCAPGTSEHQTGLSTDVIQTTLPSKYRSLIQEFGDTECGKWLAENCYRFGFVLRFPKDKQKITGIVYEPWHFRFVGRYHATRMYELNMCLEEYIEYLTDTGYFD